MLAGRESDYLRDLPDTSAGVYDVRQRVLPMRTRVLLLALAASFSAEAETIAGFVQSVAGTDVQVASGMERIAIHVSCCAAQLSALRPWRQVRMQVHRGILGNLIADRIEASVAVAGVVGRAMAPNGFELIAEGDSFHEVQLTPATQFSFGAKELPEGTAVLVTGWDVGERRIEALRIAVYNTDAPMTRNN